MAEKVKVLVEYIWTPSQCKHCCVFGHKSNSCGKEKEGKDQVGKNQEENRDDGFTQVRRKQWRVKNNKGNNFASTSGVNRNAEKKDEEKKTGNEEKEQTLEQQTVEKNSQDGESKKEESSSKEEKNDKLESPKKVPMGSDENRKVISQGIKGGTQTPGQIPFYQSVLKSFQPRRGVPLQTSNRFATFSSSDDDDGNCVVGPDARKDGGESDGNKEMNLEEELETAVPDD